MKILLTDGDQRSTLAAVRALGTAGHEVFVAETATPSLASRSRHCRGAVTYPSPYDHEEAFVRSIDESSRQLGIDLIIPMTDITSAVLAEHRATLASRVRVAVMDAETFWRASDKNSLHRLAESLGVPTPTLHYVERPSDLQHVPELSFPCVIKPSRSRLRTAGEWMKTAVVVARSREEFDTLLQTRPELQHPFMIQRVVDGEGIGVFALCEHGEIRALFAHRRIREKPPWGGVSVLREAVAPDADAAEYATRILRALKWHGVAMVEFKRDRATGTPNLMEVNARFWGSLQLAIDAGVNFPVHAARLWLGESVSAQPPYRTGVRSRWLLGDLDHLILRVSANGSTPADAPPLPALLLDFCRFFRRDTHYEVESWRDPGPSLHEVRAYIHDIFRSLSRSRH
jgi:predicted ATP-grasp superfamily ATP-dependent carboligase